MKKMLLTAIVGLLWLNSYSQKLGYKQIEIGKNISILKDNYFNFKEIEDNGETKYLVADNDFKICDKGLEYILVSTDKNKTITQVQLFTKEMDYKDYTAFFDDFKNFIYCFTDTFGKPTTADIANPKDGQKTVTWTFNTEMVTMGLWVDDMSTFAKGEKRRYSIAWQKFEKTKLW